MGVLGGGQAMLDQDFLLRLAQRVREMMLRARTDIARDQLRLWAEEFEGNAAELDGSVRAGRQFGNSTC